MERGSTGKKDTPIAGGELNGILVGMGGLSQIAQKKTEEKDRMRKAIIVPKAICKRAGEVNCPHSNKRPPRRVYMINTRGKESRKAH